MLTPSDIQRKVFTKGVRGYREEEVDDFLDEITSDFEAVLRENESLRETNAALAKENARVKESETGVYQTLESAKELMAEIASSAEKRAEIVLKNAELDAERIRREADESVERLTDRANALNNRWELFSARFRNLLETELERFESSASVLLEGGDFSRGTGKSAKSANSHPIEKDLEKELPSIANIDVEATRKY